jgi:hypothetical protein
MPTAASYVICPTLREAAGASTSFVRVSGVFTFRNIVEFILADLLSWWMKLISKPVEGTLIEKLPILLVIIVKLKNQFFKSLQ